MHVSSSRVSPHSAPTTTIVHIPPPSCLIQHRIPTDTQWPSRSSKAYWSPWVSAFVVASETEWLFSTARQLLAISQPCSSIFTLLPDGPPHRFQMPCSPPRSKDFESPLHVEKTTAISLSPHSLVSSTFPPSSRPIITDLDLSLACLGKAYSPKSRAGW